MESLPLDVPAIKNFIVEHPDQLKVCTAIRALTCRLQVSPNPKMTIQNTFKQHDLLSCEQSEPQVLDHLLRQADKLVRW